MKQLLDSVEIPIAIGAALVGVALGEPWIAIGGVVVAVVIIALRNGKTNS